MVLEPQRPGHIQVVINDRGIMEWKRSIALINDPPPIPHLQVPFYDRPGSIVRTSFLIERILGIICRKTDILTDFFDFLHIGVARIFITEP